MQFSIQELDVFVYTVEEVNLDRLEKHILMWKVDLVENRMHRDVKNIGWIVSPGAVTYGNVTDRDPASSKYFFPTMNRKSHRAASDF
jgi:hypothetical protein